MKNKFTTFIANDGTVFDNEFDCRLYDGIAAMANPNAPFKIYSCCQRLIHQEDLDAAQLIFVLSKATDDDKKNLIALLTDNYNTNIIDHDGEPIALGDLALFDNIRVGWYYIYRSATATGQWHFIDCITVNALRQHRVE